MGLIDQKCIPCEGGTLPLTIPQANELMQELSYWNLSSDAKQINKTYKFKDWKEAHAFVNTISEIAEREGHHPDVDLHWGRVGVSLMTHAIGGLSVNDFILAAKIDKSIKK